MPQKIFVVTTKGMYDTLQKKKKKCTCIEIRALLINIL